MILKTLFILGDIGFFSNNLNAITGHIGNQIVNNDAVVLLGDNFYPEGIKNNNDPLWKDYDRSFKDINAPIYSILGNHDYLQNPSCQINNKKWIMDDWYYKKEYDNIDLYFLDTVQFNIHNWVTKRQIESAHNLDYKILIENQIDWLDFELSKNPKKNKILFGHYPIITNGFYHDKVGKLHDYLIDIFNKHNVNLYISGHEHNIQYNYW